MGVECQHNTTTMRKFFICVGLAFSLASCAVSKSTFEYEIEELSGRTLEAVSTMLVTPVIADLDVSQQRVTYIETAAFANKEVTKDMISNLDDLKAVALANAAQYYNADIMVGSIINVRTVNKHLVITVQGYPATYKNFRNVTLQDLEVVKGSKVFDFKSSPIKSPKKVIENIIPE